MNDDMSSDDVGFDRRGNQIMQKNLNIFEFMKEMQITESNQILFYVLL